MKETPGWANDCHITVYDDDDSPFDGVVELLRRCVGVASDSWWKFSKACLQPLDHREA